MNILYLGWANPILGEKQGGGYNLVASEVAKGLAQDPSYNVYYLFAGQSYECFRIFPSIKFNSKWHNVNVFELVNSSFMSPGIKSFWKVLNCSFAQQLILRRFISENKINVVHVQSFEGFGTGVVDLFKEMNLRIIYTPHDSYVFCAQVHRMYKNIYRCDQNEKGLKCTRCQPFEIYFFRRMQKQFEGFLLVKKFFGLLNRISVLVIKQSFLERIFSTLFKKRTEFNVAQLNKTDVILSPSSFLANELIHRGVEKDKIVRGRIGLPHIDFLRSLHEGPLGITRKKDNSTRVGIAYFGPATHHKGFYRLIELINNTSIEILDRVEFYFFCKMPEDVSLKKNVSVNFMGPYSIHDLNKYSSLYEVVICPNICFENSPLVVLEQKSLGKLIIYSKFGGSKELIDSNDISFDPENENSLDFIDKIFSMGKMVGYSSETGFSDYILLHKDIYSICKSI